jgi:hypothetical protein
MTAKGDCYMATETNHVQVMRVAKDETWADIRVTQPSGYSWTKRQPLPFPQDWRRL